MKAFLEKKNIKISFKRYVIDSLNAMAIGLFGSLIIGLVLKNIGHWIDYQPLVECGLMAQKATGVAIAVAIAYTLEAPALVLVAATAVGLVANTMGGVVGTLIATMFAVEIGKLVSKTTSVDILVTPATTLIVGMSVAYVLGEPIRLGMLELGNFIEAMTELRPFMMSILLAVVMGMLLTLPISSAAIAISLSLSGEAGGAATIGCAAQMIGFAVISFRDNNIGGVISQGLGTSMLQIPNIIRNPKIWLPSIVSSAIIAPIAIVLFNMKNVPTGSGMGTSGLVGQIGTIEAMGNSTDVIIQILMFHFVAPAVLSYLVYLLLLKIGWIKKGDLKLNID